MNLLILKEQDRLDGDTFVVDGNRCKHILGVLRAKNGDTVEVGLINGPIGTATLKSVENNRIVFECVWSEQSDLSEPGIPQIDIICALPRPQTFKKVVQVCATMGVSRIHFVNANRVEQCYFSASVTKPEMIRYYLEKGLSQGKRTGLPKVIIHPRFRCFFEETLPRLEADENEKVLKLVADVDAHGTLKGLAMQNFERICIAIGPEGGWVPFELDIMKEHGFKKFNLGSSPLRVEHALVAALSQAYLIM